MDSHPIPFSGSCSPVRVQRKRFPKQMCMAQLKMPSSPKYAILSIHHGIHDSSDSDEDQPDECDNLRLHRQKSWLSKRTADTTLLSLRSMTSLQRKSFRALFDILDSDKTGIVCLSKLAKLLQSLGADITLSKLLRVTETSYITKYPHLKFIQFCALLLRDDLKVKLRNKSMDRINKMRYERQQYIKNMQYIRDTPTEGQRQVIELRKKLDELEALSTKKKENRLNHSNHGTSISNSHRERYSTNLLNGTRVFQMPISVFIQSWHRKQLINELEQHSFLSNSTVHRTREYVSKSCKAKSGAAKYNISIQSAHSHKSGRPTALRTRELVEEGLLSRRNLINTLDSAIDRNYKCSSNTASRSRSRSKRQIFDFDVNKIPKTNPSSSRLAHSGSLNALKAPTPNTGRHRLSKSCSEAVLKSHLGSHRQFAPSSTSSTRSFSKAVSRAMRQMHNSVQDDCAMYSLTKSKEAVKHEVSSCHALSPKTLKKCMSSPTFRGVRQSSTKTPAERFLLKRNSTLPRLLCHA